jgi:hypothetical protein
LARRNQKMPSPRTASNASARSTAGMVRAWAAARCGRRGCGVPCSCVCRWISCQRATLRLCS